MLTYWFYFLGLWMVSLNLVHYFPTNNIIAVLPYFIKFKIIYAFVLFTTYPMSKHSKIMRAWFSMLLWSKFCHLLCVTWVLWLQKLEHFLRVACSPKCGEHIPEFLKNIEEQEQEQEHVLLKILQCSGIGNRCSWKGFNVR